MIVKIPNLSLVVLIGPSGSGKSSFAARHFLKTEIVSSDTCRGLVCDDDNDQLASDDAFDLLHYTIEKRLKRGRLTVVDATNVQAASRKRLIDIARSYHVIPVAIAFSLPEEMCHERNAGRENRQFGRHVVRNQTRDLRTAIKWMRKEGFRHTFVLHSVDEVDSVEIQRDRLWNDRRDEPGPFDIVGDVHGCYGELVDLLVKLGYTVDSVQHTAVHPDGRKAVFVGDLVDRGPDSPSVLKLAMNMVAEGVAICVPGNHDIKLVRQLGGANVQLNHGLDKTVKQLSRETPEFSDRVAKFLDGLVSHYVFAGGKLVVAHAGMPENMQGRGSARVREFALYGETTGEVDEFGLPVRYKWAEDYRGSALVAYGHTPVPEVEFLNNTVCLDTGCAFGGKLSALRFPEREVVDVPARMVYAEPARPLSPAMVEIASQHMADDTLDIDDYRKRMHVVTQRAGTVIVPEENALAALEVMTRFAANPKWLVYLPPTMSPSETSSLDGFLEHPAEAFEYFRSNDVSRVICEEKHMGSRAVVVLCRDEDVARERFGVVGEGIGVVVSRTGRRFFDGADLEQALLQRLVAAMARSGLWEELETDWVVLDCELMPWSAKAQGLLSAEYAPVGSAGMASLTSVNRSLVLARDRLDSDPNIVALQELFAEKQRSVEAYIDAYRRYCWTVKALDDYKLAPFHILASEGAVHCDKDHLWHMSLIDRLTDADPGVLRKTSILEIEPSEASSTRKGVDWWLDLTGKGGEGMVIKPIDFCVRGPKGIVQPALKCRGREYLRIIYGPEYLHSANLSRLRRRSVSRKRRLAQNEFVLGIEALERFVHRQPLRNIHECVFAVLALESEAVDSRL